MYDILFFIILVMVCMQLSLFRDTSTYVEDSLAASNLASAVIDIQEYGRTHNIIIAEPYHAYEIYQKALKDNLVLNDNWECPGKAAITGRIEILSYIIYNITGNKVDIYSYGKDGTGHSTILNGLGTVKAPNGQTIQSTSVYSKVAFPVDGIMGVHVDAKKDKLVDVVDNMIP